MHSLTWLPQKPLARIFRRAPPYYCLVTFWKRQIVLCSLRPVMDSRHCLKAHFTEYSVALASFSCRANEALFCYMFRTSCVSMSHYWNPNSISVNVHISCYSLLSLYDIIIQYNMTFHSQNYLRKWMFAKICKKKKKSVHKTLWRTLFASNDLEWEGLGSDGWQNVAWAKRIQVWKGMFEQIYAVAQPVRRLCLPSIVPIWLWNIIFALKPSHHLF